MTTADDVRQYAVTAIILPAKRRGMKTVTFSSSDVHNGMGLAERFPLVCSAIDAKKFEEFAGVLLVNRKGPKQSSTVKWTFEIAE